LYAFKSYVNHDFLDCDFNILHQIIAQKKIASDNTARGELQTENLNLLALNEIFENLNKDNRHSIQCEIEP